MTALRVATNPPRNWVKFGNWELFHGFSKTLKNYFFFKWNFVISCILIITFDLINRFLCFFVLNLRNSTKYGRNPWCVTSTDEYRQKRWKNGIPGLKMLIKAVIFNLLNQLTDFQAFWLFFLFESLNSEISKQKQ